MAIIGSDKSLWHDKSLLESMLTYCQLGIKLQLTHWGREMYVCVTKRGYHCSALGRHFCWGSWAPTIWIPKGPKQNLKGPSIEIHYQFSNFREAIGPSGKISQGPRWIFRGPGPLPAGPESPALVQIMACRLFGTKPLTKPAMDYFQLDPCEYISVKFYPKYNNFHVKKKSAKLAAILSRPQCGKFHGKHGNAFEIGVCKCLPFSWGISMH